MTDPSAARRLLRNAYRELTVCGIVWLVAMFWTLGVCLLYGYRHDPDSWLVRSGWARSPEAADIAYVFGFPDWIFYGVVLPWITSTVFTLTFCLWIMHDDDLGHEGEGPTDAAP